MDETTRKIRRLSPAKRMKFLAFVVWLRVCELVEQATPQAPHEVGEPVTFAIIASSISLALLPIMPHRALSLAVAFGGGLSLAIFLVCVRRSAARAYWIGQ